MNFFNSNPDVQNTRSVYIKIILVICFCLISSSLIAQNGINGNLVSVEWLNKNLKNPDIVLLDASPVKFYSLNHIPGAINVDFFTYGSQDDSIDYVQQLYQSWGISRDKKIVIYDQGGSIFATRQFYSLYYYDFPVENLFILDGGLSKWQETGLPVAQDKTTPTGRGNFRIQKINEEVKAELPEFLSASGDTKNNALVEALTPDWHFGEVCAFDKAGHIPNAILLPSPDFFNPDKTFKSPDEIKKILAFLKIDPEKNIYSHCGGGISASVPFFALKFILHYPVVKLYVGSELEWLSDDRGLPYWTYDKPYLLRETNWLQFWGGKMLRMYGRSNVSIIDIRSEEEFNKGHIPFAVNIPSEIFKTYIKNLNQLADILGRSGVNQAHEAVIVSGTGITKDAALVFLILEKLNQKKISIFTDTMDNWKEAGYSLTTDSTIIGDEKSSQGLTISRTIYSINLRQDILVSDTNNSQHSYPIVFIESGDDASKIKKENSVHLVGSDLLNAEGTPKAAKDLWKILIEAGVTRYSELICFSTEPGEAAIDYFILKLMGYPEVKVLIN